MQRKPPDTTEKRRLVSDASEHVRHGHWHDNRQDTFWGADPRNMTLGIFGFGAIGQAVARRARPFGFRIIYYRRNRLAPELERELDATFVPFETLIETADVLSLHVPLTDETRGRLGRAELARMRRGSFIINTARGGVIDEPALIDALTDGQVAGVGLDVTATEPEGPSHAAGTSAASVAKRTARTDLIGAMVTEKA